MWTDNYCYALQCGAFGDGEIPVGAPLYPPSRDAEFSASFNAMVWPKAAIGAGSFWNFKSLTDSELETRIEEFAERLASANLDSCPIACTCDELTRCGSPYITGN